MIEFAWLPKDMDQVLFFILLHNVGASFPFPFSFSEENRRLRRANVVYQPLKGQKDEMVFVTISTNLG